MKENEIKVAEYLLQIKAIKLDPANPFTWASGWKSPIYCDNRKTLSFPEVRGFIKKTFVEVVNKNFPDVQVIAGVATGAIAIGALVAEALDLPFIYVRPKAKDHGLGNQIEGSVEPGQKVVVIEDLISTGGSSLGAVKALRDFGCSVEGMAAIFSYQFPVAENRFAEEQCKLITLSNYPVLVNLASQIGHITEEQQLTLSKWREDPGNWDPKK